jgi:DNA-binding Lrp family transcriptional regulator
VSKKEKEVKELYTSTEDHMILAKVVFRTNEELREFVKRLEKNKMIKKFCPAIVLERLK